MRKAFKQVSDVYYLSHQATRSLRDRNTWYRNHSHNICPWAFARLGHMTKGHESSMVAQFTSHWCGESASGQFGVRSRQLVKLQAQQRLQDQVSKNGAGGGGCR